MGIIPEIVDPESGAKIGAKIMWGRRQNLQDLRQNLAPKFIAQIIGISADFHPEQGAPEWPQGHLCSEHLHQIVAPTFVNLGAGPHNLGPGAAKFRH